MVSIARKNLFHDKIRFAVALAGISFAVVLITVQLGVYLAFRSNVSVLIDHTEADIWITSHGLENFDFGRPFSEKKVYEVEEVPGVAWADKYFLAFGYWKTPGGSQAMKHGHLPILLPLPVRVGIFMLTVIMCLWSSVLSISKVMRVDPAMVFKS